MISILVTGISGRMGQAIQEAVTQNPDTCVGSTHDQGQELYPALAKCDVAIDFSHHAFTSTLLAEAVANNKPLVIGTTGHTELERQEIVDAAASIPIVFASNYSVGVNALFWLTRKAAQILGGSCDIEVMEMHHRHKIDAPSGTARTLAEILSGAIDRNYEDSVVFGREGLVGPRPAKEIGMHSLRGGDVVGDHTVIFASDGERLELTHKASSRMTFASGAVRAALWLQGREPGLYTMEDGLGLSQLELFRHRGRSSFPERPRCFLLMKRAGIALGSNLGDKNSLMVQARDHLLQMSLSDDPFLQSSLYATSPQGCPHGADDYLNAVVEFTWPGTVEELLVHCQGIERVLGRIRSGIRCEPRTADVDIIYVGDMVVNDPPRLILPHPRAHLRKFVLKPLSDIRPELILPRQHKTVACLLAELDTDEADPLLVSERW